jgi:hypothetical protein
MGVSSRSCHLGHERQFSGCVRGEGESCGASASEVGRGRVPRRPSCQSWVMAAARLLRRLHRDDHATAAIDPATHRSASCCRRQDGRDRASRRVAAPLSPSCRRDGHPAAHSRRVVPVLSRHAPPHAAAKGALSVDRSAPGLAQLAGARGVGGGGSAAGGERLRGHCHCVAVVVCG